MKNVFFLSWPIYSHVKNSIPIIEELLSLNYKIFYFGDEKFKYLLENLDIKFISYNVKRKLDIFSILNKEFREIGKIKEIKDTEEFFRFVKLQCICKIKFYNIYSNKVEKVLKKQKCDILIHDACAYYGKVISEKFGIKSCAYVTSLLFDEKYLENNISNGLKDAYHFKMQFLNKSNEKEILSKVKEIHKNISEKYNVPMYPIMGSVDTCEENNIIFSSTKLQPETKKKNNLICKPKIFTRKRNTKNKKMLIYVSTGAYLTADETFYNRIIGAFRDTEYEVVISLPSLDEAKIINMPKNIKIVKQTNQAEILSEAKVFITHGGYNGICEAIYNEVPMLVYPLTNDQYLNATLIKKLKIGYLIKPEEISQKNIYGLIEKIIQDKEIEENLKKHNKYMNSEKELKDELRGFIENL